MAPVNGVQCRQKMEIDNDKGEIGGQGAKGFDSMEYIWKRRDLNMYVGQQRRWSKLKWQN